MQSAVGIFRSISEAKEAVADLRAAGIPQEKINLLTPGDLNTVEQELAQVPKSETEQPGIGKGIGALLGGAIGAAGGLSAGSAIASLFIPGVGPVIAAGLAAAGLLGVGGAAAGAAAGEKFENANTAGLPEDEIFFYEDALRRGRTVVVAFSDENQQLEAARKIFAARGAESIDAARETWWTGLRDAEQEHYQAPGDGAAKRERTYRSGYEAALRPDTRGKSYAESKEMLNRTHSQICEDPIFVRGYERGREFEQRLRSSTEDKPQRRVA